MKIELKSLKIYEGMSEETIAFTADLFVNGNKLAYCKNDGHGGDTYYNRYPNVDKDLLVIAEDYCKTLPMDSSLSFECPKSLESVIDDLVYAEYNKKNNAKAQKKLQKHMLTGICYGTINEYGHSSWSGLTIAEMLTSSTGRGIIRAKIFQLKNEGKNILNTNLPNDFL